ncbi:unnamed protein product [Meloidogyne enterolobii]|uniref:Uncharacterized protein n=1 Tax=Meloidogyne enterolobii TaxID=390850 RepID=A0ACB1ARM6_MELEN
MPRIQRPLSIFCGLFLFLRTFHFLRTFPSFADFSFFCGLFLFADFLPVFFKSFIGI